MEECSSSHRSAGKRAAPGNQELPVIGGEVSFCAELLAGDVGGRWEQILTNVLPSPQGVAVKLRDLLLLSPSMWETLLQPLGPPGT